MDEERIGLVLAKTSELRSKIICCIHKTSFSVEGEARKVESQESEVSPDAKNQDFDGDEQEEEDSLLNIKDALESLEGQLSSLQALQQQQWYEQEAALSEIVYSQKKLLNELKEYKGKDLNVIHEAIAFASLTEDNTDLLLPPYPSHPSINGAYLSAIPHHKLPQNGSLKNPDNSYKNNSSNGNRGPLKSFGGLIGTVAKAALTVVGVIAIMSLAGKRDNGFVRVVELFRVKGERESGGGGCPPGKVAVVMGDGETRCVVKERVEVPFETVVVDVPDVSYGCG